MAQRNDTVPIRCPYCDKVFKTFADVLQFGPSVKSKTFRCPNCNEEIIIRKEQAEKFMSKL